MAEASNTPVKANTAVPHQGDHDRVAMLSLNANGTANQHNPEIIISKEAATEAATKQFTEQAVSAADAELRGAHAANDTTLVGDDGETVKTSELPQDPQIAELKTAHDKASEAATKAAESSVDKLVKD